MMSATKILFATVLFTGLLTAVTPFSASATCTSADYMEKIQGIQGRLMELGSEDPDKMEEAMERLREVAQGMTTTFTGGMTPDNMDVMCKKLDEMREALE